jgi:holin-like protein
MLEAILLIFSCQLAGEAGARLLGLPVPGPVIGMVLLFAGLQARRAWRPEAVVVAELPVGIVAAFLLGHLSLLFVPAGVGIISHIPTLLTHGLGLVAALVVSTALSLAVTAVVFDRLSRHFDRSGEP